MKKKDHIKDMCDELETIFDGKTIKDKTVSEKFQKFNDFCVDYTLSNTYDGDKKERKDRREMQFLESKSSFMGSINSILQYVMIGFAFAIASVFQTYIFNEIDTIIAPLLIGNPWYTLITILVQTVVFVLLVILIVSILNMVKKRVDVNENAKNLFHFLYIEKKKQNTFDLK